MDLQRQILLLFLEAIIFEQMYIEGTILIKTKNMHVYMYIYFRNLISNNILCLIKN